MLYQIIATLLLLVFYGVYFAKLFRQRRQGIQTDLLGKGKTGLVKGIEITLKIATYLVLFAEVISILAEGAIDLIWLRAAGALLGILGVGIFVVSVITMRDSWRAGVPEDEKTELITSGIYAYSRNPAFLGFDLLYIGELFLFFNWGLLVITILAVVMLHLQIVYVEEVFLIRAFGEEYLAYKKRVGRYLGKRNRN